MAIYRSTQIIVSKSAELIVREKVNMVSTINRYGTSGTKNLITYAMFDIPVSISTKASVL